MFHCAAYTMAAPFGATNDIPALADDILYIQNNHFLPQNDMFLLAAATLGASVTRSSLKSPKLNQITPQYIRPHIRAALPPANPNVSQWFKTPFKLNGQEEIANSVTNDLGAATERENTIILLSTQAQTDDPPQGDSFVARFTSTTAATANAWSSISATYDQQIPVGTYKVQWAELQSTNIIAFRTIFDNQYWRPGFLGISALGNRLPDWYYRGELGTWGLFRTTSLPRWQVLCNAADAAFEGYVKFIRTGP